MRFRLAWFGGMLLTSMAGVALAQGAANYPDRPVRMIVPFSPGGGTDSIARLLAQKLNERWNQPVIVENRTGGNGNIGAQYVAKAPADGYTILVSSNAMTINPSLHDNAGYQQSEFTPVILLASSPFLVVTNPKMVSAATWPDFLAWAKSKNGAVAWASTSEGNAEHLAGSLLQRMAGFQMRHIPYKGGADALKDVVGGHVEVGVLSLPTSLAYIQGGQLRVIGLTSTKRVPQLPDVATIAEMGITGFDITTWYAVWVPAGVPADIVDKIHAALDASLKLEDVQKRVVAIGFTAGGGPRAAFAEYTAKETEKYAKVIQQLGLKKQ
jgi:tripartite-type tricarboxylate transporter receptor subunit TctC